MIPMTLTIEPDIGLSFLLQAALPPQLVTDREMKLIVVGDPHLARSRPGLKAR
jgi:hypothetical protein